MLGAVRSLVGDFTVEIDRKAMLVIFKAKGKEYKYTYDQLVDELEKMLQ